MMFGDAPRMTSLHLGRDGGTACHKSESTKSHLGPGSYYTAHNENIRGGWIKRSFSNREPMVQGGRRWDRHHHYHAGILVNGLHASGNTNVSGDTPGPGHYNVQKPPESILRGGNQRPGKFDPHASHNMSVMSGGGMRSTSSRLLHESASLKNGMLFLGTIDDHSHIGPGHYHKNRESTLMKKSFNARVNSPRGARQQLQQQQQQQQQRTSASNSPRSHSRSQQQQQYAYSPSQSDNYSGMYSPRYSNQYQRDEGVERSPQEQQQQYYDGGEFDEEDFYEDASVQQAHADADAEAQTRVLAQAQAQAQSQTPPSVFQVPVSSSDRAPVPAGQEYDASGNLVHTSGKKVGRKMGRMSVMESMVPTMFRKQE